MADFRKWVLVFAVLALAFSANAQITCISSSGGANVLVRQEGLAELTGDIVLTCTGTSPTPVTINVQIFLNTNVTSRNYANGSGGFLSQTESLLLLGDDVGGPGSGLGVKMGDDTTAPVLSDGTITGAAGNTYYGRLGTFSNSLVWTNIPLLLAAAPTSTTRTIRITNVRANANAIPSGAGLPGAIVALITVQTVQTVTLALPQAQVTVAAVVAGMRDVSVLKVGSTSGYATHTYQQCTGNQSGFAGDITKTASLDFEIRYRENFNTAYKVIGTPGSIPGQPLVSESGTNPGEAVPTPVANSLGVGQASQGTRLFARFANVPTGVRIFVTTTNSSGFSTGATGPRAILVGFDPAAGGTGAAPPDPASTNPSTTGVAAGISFNSATASGGYGLAEVTLTGGTGSAVWEVTAANSAALDEFRFGVVVAIPSNLTISASPTPTATVAGGFAPISTVTTSSSSAPVPRFADTSDNKNTFNVALCVTNLLYPYVTNQGGFDTGIAIINTSLDNATGSSGSPANQPFKTTPQHGTCTVYYFGAMASGGQLPAPQTTTDIAAGQMVAFAVSQGGVAGSTSSAAGFQGYLIVRCNFQFAHGFAFVSDVGANRVSHGYLALVIPDGQGSSRNAVSGPDTYPSGGEQLTQ